MLFGRGIVSRTRASGSSPHPSHINCSLVQSNHNRYHGECKLMTITLVALHSLAAVSFQIQPMTSDRCSRYMQVRRAQSQALPCSTGWKAQRAGDPGILICTCRSRGSSMIGEIMGPEVCCQGYRVVVLESGYPAPRETQLPLDGRVGQISECFFSFLSNWHAVPRPISRSPFSPPRGFPRRRFKSAGLVCFVSLDYDNLRISEQRHIHHSQHRMSTAVRGVVERTFARNVIGWPDNFPGLTRSVGVF